MKQFKKMYVEITNVCNLSCSFCPPTKRKSKTMSVAEFTEIAEKIRPFGSYLYLHIKGEPLMHKDLQEILAVCERLEFQVCITTNGTLLKQQKEVLLKSKAVHRLHISLHSFEANAISLTLEEYLEEIVDIIKQADFLIILRLWNGGGMEALNNRILTMLKANFDFLREDKVNEKTYLQMGDQFEWADMERESQKETGFCYALRDQIGILVDGTVVPCCLDNNGDIALGNIFEQSLDDIYMGNRAQNLYNGFSNRKFAEKLCRTCGFINRF
ncbi:radical SAM/SPASM domain-containing protein [Chakrabartyella piscis]|uniref:radical SAM/SPASM domain-containing protein n=1 Tax=Chakrabartyella piscis TaxID=2918914 RepID=UPI002958D676|nr:radical SAM/SPASM domain-containing protein [Chakrabartyella piscis]